MWNISPAELSSHYCFQKCSDFAHAHVFKGNKKCLWTIQSAVAAAERCTHHDSAYKRVWSKHIRFEACPHIPTGHQQNRRWRKEKRESLKSFSHFIFHRYVDSIKPSHVAVCRWKTKQQRTHSSIVHSLCTLRTLNYRCQQKRVNTIWNSLSHAEFL